MKDFRDTVTVVTGGRVGVGKALAREAARRGSSVVIASRSDASATVDELRKEGGTVDWTFTDVRDPASWSALRDFVHETYGRVNVLVNNAAAGAGDGSLESSSLEALDEVIATNILGYVHGIRTFGDDLRSSAAAGALAYILNVGSEHSLGVPPHVMPLSPYTVSKQAGLAITEVARRDFAGSGVQVTLTAPGWVLTENVQSFVASSEEFAEAVRPYAQESELVARRSFDGLLEGRDIVVTNPMSVPFARDRAQRLLEDLDWAEQNMS